MPRAMQLGFAVFALGALLDLVYHLSPGAWTPTLELYLGEEARLAHLVTLVGMAMTLTGLLSWRFRHVSRSKLGWPSLLNLRKE